jgi:hypothetical protein
MRSPASEVVDATTYGHRVIFVLLRFVINTLVAFIMDDPGCLATLEPVIEGFEAGQCFDPLWGHLLAPAGHDHLWVVRQKPQDAVGPEAPGQLAHGFRGRVGLHGPLGGGPVVKEDSGAQHLIAPLDLSDKVECELGTIRQGFHPRCSPLSPRCGLHSDETSRRGGERAVGGACR